VAIVPLGYLVIVVVVTVLVKVAVTVWVKNDRLHVLIVASLMSIEHGPHDDVPAAVVSFSVRKLG
jgi:hypothetical protein